MIGDISQNQIGIRTKGVNCGTSQVNQMFDQRGHHHGHVVVTGVVGHGEYYMIWKK